MAVGPRELLIDPDLSPQKVTSTTSGGGGNAGVGGDAGGSVGRFPLERFTELRHERGGRVVIVYK